MKILIAAVICIVIFLALCSGLNAAYSRDILVAAEDTGVTVTNSRISKTTDFAENLLVEAFVENTTDKYVKNVTVTLQVIDPSGVSGFDGRSSSRTYGTYYANISELGPRGTQWVTITTPIGKPQNLNAGARSFEIELSLPNKDFTTTKVILTYRFSVSVGRYSDSQ